MDVNHWKTQAHAVMKSDFGGDNTVGIFGRNSNGKRIGPRYHTELADQICAEYAIRVESKLQSVFEWKIKSVARDNEMLDALVGNLVAASQEGIESTSSKTPVQKTRGTNSRFKDKYMASVGKHS